MTPEEIQTHYNNTLNDEENTSTITRVKHVHLDADTRLSLDYLENQSKNANSLYNRAIYLQRQVLTAYSKSSNPGNWHEPERETIQKINQASEHYNKTRIATLKSEIKKTKNEETKRQKREQIKQYEANPPLVDEEHRTLTINKLCSYFAYHRATEPAYNEMVAQVAQQTIKEAARAFTSWRAALADWKQNPQKYKQRPGIPGYRTRGASSELLYPAQTFKLEWADDDTSRLSFAKNYGKDTFKKIDLGSLISRKEVEEKSVQISCVKVIPQPNGWDVQLVLKRERPELRALNGRYCGGDLGLDNLIALVSNAVNTTPLIVEGKLIKSINQYYNKKNAAITANYNGCYTSREKKRLWRKRDAQLGDLLGQAGNIVMDWLVENDISLFVLGYNAGWKDSVGMGARNNQAFVSVPFARFRDILRDKCEERGIAFMTTEESYTSKASLVDLDSLPSYGVDDGEYSFSGSRVHRGLYRASSVLPGQSRGIVLNADLNGAGNILRKVVPDAFDEVVDWRFLMNPCKVRLSFGLSGEPKLSRRASARARCERVVARS